MKSRLGVKNLDLSSKVIKAIREKVSIGTVNGKRTLKFIEEQVTPAINDNATSEVEFDTSIVWQVLRRIVTWAKAYGGSDYDRGSAITLAENGDIIVVGLTTSFGTGGNNFWVLRLDGEGNIKWQKAYGGGAVPYAVTVAPNGDIVVAGYTYSFGAGGVDFWVLRLDEDGNIKWQKAYGGSSDEVATAIAIAPNGDIIVAGYTYSFGAGGVDFWVLRLDEEGNVKWQKAYGGGNVDTLNAVTIAENGDIIVVGETYSFGVGERDILVLRLDENGNIKWQKAYGGNGEDLALTVTIAPNGDIIVAGETESFGAGRYDVIVLRLDENGNIKWQKAYGGSSDDRANAVTVAPNGDIVVVGYTNSFGAGGVDFWVLRLDEEGNVKWQKAYGGSEYEEASAVTVAPNGDIIAAGYTNSFGAGDSDVIVLRLDENGNVSASQLTVTDTNCTVTDTNCIVTDTNCTVTDTSCTVTDTTCTVTETDCVVTEL